MIVGGGDARNLKGLATSWELTPYEPYDLAVTSDGSVWVASDSEVLAFDPADGTYTVYTASLGPPTPDFSMITPDGNDILWISDYSGERIVRFDPVTGVFTPYPLPHPLFNSPVAPFGITPGPDGAVWFTTHYSDYAIGRLDPTSSSFQRFEPPGGADRGMPVEIVFDAAGIAWFTLDMHHGRPGLGRLDPSSGAFTTWPDPYPGAMTPFGIVILDGTIWFADHGASTIVSFEPATEAFTPYPAPSTFTDAHFLTIGKDGRLYSAALATSSIAAFDPATGEYAVRRLVNQDCVPMGITTAPSGQIWWAEDSRIAVDYGGVGRLTPFASASLAVGVPGEDLAAVDETGAVNVIFGSSSGLEGGDDQMWDQDALGGSDAGEPGDEFGYALASGDFNGDGSMDLAIGVHREDVGTAEDGGAVRVLYGTPDRGLVATGSGRWHQGSPGIDGAVESGDQFGWSLAAGDFDGDGFSDLAIGVPFEDLEPLYNAGCVNVIYGSASGLHSTGDRLFTQDTGGIDGAAEHSDMFGYSLATGDFNHDGFDDLAVGVPFEDLEPLDDAGVVHIIYGSASGLTDSGDQLWSQDSSLVEDEAEAGDQFGFSLAAGNFDGDEWDDLAIGANHETVDGVVEAGVVHVLFGWSAGLVAVGDELWHQDVSGVLDTAEAGDAFGQALAAGDLDGDGYDDLVAGVPFENLPGKTWAGAVSVLYGTSSGLTAAGDQLWHQDSPGIDSSIAETWDRFGFRVTTGDFDFDGFDDLAVGVPYESIASLPEAGGVNVLYGSSSGITASGEQLWHQNRSDVLDASQSDDYFGYAIVALYLENLTLFADGFESGDLSAWSSYSP
jgi:streptogramin lyase